MSHRRNYRSRQPRHFRGTNTPRWSGISVVLATSESRKPSEPVRDYQQTRSAEPMHLSGRRLVSSFAVG